MSRIFPGHWKKKTEIDHIPGDKVLSNTWRASMVDGSLEEGDVGGKREGEKKEKAEMKELKDS